MNEFPPSSEPKKFRENLWSKSIRNRDGQVRVGWKLLAFVILLNVIGFSLDFALHHFVKGGFPTPLRKILDVLVVLVPTWLFVNLEKRSFLDLGLRLNPLWFRDLVFGFLLACALMTIASSGVAVIQGGWVRSHQDFGVLLRGLFSFLGVAIFEELGFRGYPFQRMVENWGVEFAQGLMVVFFVLPHLLVGLYLGYPGPTMIGASLNIGCAALLLGFAFLWTRSLALPIGIHWGWNWMQGSVLGLGVSGSTTSSFLHPARSGPEVSWITGGTYGPEASIIGTIAVLVGIGIIWDRLRRKPYIR